MEKRYLNIDETSEYLGTPVPTLYTWVSLRKIPHLKISRRCLKFDIKELEQWLDKKREPCLK